jgi:hypothetical protein
MQFYEGISAGGKGKRAQVPEKKTIKFWQSRGNTSSRKFSQYDRQDTQRVEMCDTDDFDVSFGAQFTSFVCTKERHQLFLNQFRNQETGIYLILGGAYGLWKTVKKIKFNS